MQAGTRCRRRGCDALATYELSWTSGVKNVHGYYSTVDSTSHFYCADHVWDEVDAVEARGLRCGVHERVNYEPKRPHPRDAISAF